MLNNAIQVNGKNFVPSYGIKFFRLLSNKWGVNSIQGVVSRLVIFESITDDVTFEQIDIIADLVCAAVQANPENTETLTVDEIGDLFLVNVAEATAIVETVMKGFTASMPQPKEEGKSTAPKGARNKYSNKA